MKLYRFAWGNPRNPWDAKRVTLKGRPCRIVTSGAMGSALVEFIDNGQREVISRRALRRLTESTVSLGRPDRAGRPVSPGAHELRPDGRGDLFSQRKAPGPPAEVTR